MAPVALATYASTTRSKLASASALQSAENLQLHRSKLPQAYLDDLEVVFVQDITVDDAFLQALQGVTYVLHVASPLPGQVSKSEAFIVRKWSRTFA